jgi:hypothetical protein
MNCAAWTIWRRFNCAARKQKISVKYIREFITVAFTLKGYADFVYGARNSQVNAVRVHRAGKRSNRNPNWDVLNHTL